MNNKTLNKAKNSPNTDEWYTPYDLVKLELEHYTSQFNGARVLCNCGDSLESNFSRYFLNNFKDLNLRELVMVSYKNSYIFEHEPVAYNLIVRNSPDGLKYRFKLSENDGDFQNFENLNFIKNCDIVCTNPPFSLFSKLFDLLMEYNKKFLLITNQNAFLYKNVFPKIVKGNVTPGYYFGNMNFKVPEGGYKRLGNAAWITNLNVKINRNLRLSGKIYNPIDYPQYDNYNAIHVKSTKDIPIDYSGIMGVPLSYLQYHNPDEFEIVGEANHGTDNEYDLFKPMLNGKLVFKRLLIRRR